jgi:hypothetical protein
MPERPQGTLGLKVLAFLMAVALWGFVGISEHHLVPQEDFPSPAPTTQSR